MPPAPEVTVSPGEDNQLGRVLQDVDLQSVRASPASLSQAVRHDNDVTMAKEMYVVMTPLFP